MQNLPASGSVSNFKTPPRTGIASTLRSPLQIPPSPLLETLGYGSGIQVFKINRKAPSNSVLQSPWAVKRVRKTTKNPRAAELYGKRLENEAEILRKLHHPNIVGFRGIQKQADGRLCLVMEEGGKSLLQLIEARKEDNIGPFPAEQIMTVAAGISKALCYLHEEHHMVHADIKSGNILIKGDFDVAMLCDFGTSVPLGPDNVVTKDYTCTEPWCAPEVFNAGTDCTIPPITNKADVFSLGLVLWEMMALCVPHMEDLTEGDDLSEDEHLSDSSYDDKIGTRPNLPNEALGSSYDDVLGLFYACTESNPEDRPSAKQLVAAIDSILEQAMGNAEGVTKV